jgi:hypothetical protein
VDVDMEGLAINMDMGVIDVEEDHGGYAREEGVIR